VGWDERLPRWCGAAPGAEDPLRNNPLSPAADAPWARLGRAREVQEVVGLDVARLGWARAATPF
jgi:hypothetical protein